MMTPTKDATKQDIISDLYLVEPYICGYLPNLTQFNEDQLRSILQAVRNIKQEVAYAQ